MGRYQPSLLGGLFIGVLSSLPGVNFANCFCCLWVVTGGLLTTYLLQQRTVTPLETNVAAIGGGLAGVTGAGLAVILAPVFGPFQRWIATRLLGNLQNLPDLPPETIMQFETLLQQSTEVTLPGLLFQLALTMPLYAIMSLLGGLLGLAFFRKKPGPTEAA